MILAKFYAAADGSLHMKAAGHAAAAPKGEDLVCAGASTLAEALARAVERLYYQGMLRRCPRVELEEGRAEIIAQPKARFYKETAMVFWTVQNGMAALAAGFPGNVQLEETLRV